MSKSSEIAQLSDDDEDSLVEIGDFLTQVEQERLGNRVVSPPPPEDLPEPSLIPVELPPLPTLQLAEDPLADPLTYRMPTAAETLLGGTLRQSARSEADVLAEEIVVKKDKRNTLDSKQLDKLAECATASLEDKFDSLKPKPSTEELQNVYSVALLIKDLANRIARYDMADVFEILWFDDTTGNPLDKAPTNLLTHYKEIPLARIQKHCKYLF